MTTILEDVTNYKVSYYTIYEFDMTCNVKSVHQNFKAHFKVVFVKIVVCKIFIIKLHPIQFRINHNML